MLDVGELCRILTKLWGRRGALNTLPFEVCVTPALRSARKSRIISPPAGRLCAVFLQQKLKGIGVKINTITYFHFCSGVVREGGSQGLMLHVVL